MNIRQEATTPLQTLQFLVSSAVCGSSDVLAGSDGRSSTRLVSRRPDCFQRREEPSIEKSASRRPCFPRISAVAAMSRMFMRTSNRPFGIAQLRQSLRVRVSKHIAVHLQ